MQDGVAFVEPTRLRIHEVLQRASRQGRSASINCVAADSIDRAGAMGVHERVCVIDDHGCVDRRDAEMCDERRRQRRPHFDRADKRREALLLNVHRVRAEGQPLSDGAAFIAGNKGLPKLIGLADEFDGALNAKTRRIDHSQAKFSHAALSAKRAGKQQKQEHSFHRRSESLGSAGLAASYEKPPCGIVAACTLRCQPVCGGFGGKFPIRHPETDSRLMENPWAGKRIKAWNQKRRVFALAADYWRY